MRWKLVLLASCALLLAACTHTASATSRAEFTEAVAQLESAIGGLDEPAADTAFTVVITLLQAEPDLQTADGRSGPEVLLAAARLAHENSEVPLNSCEICTEEAACGWTEAESLSMLAYLYPDDARVQEAIDAFVPKTPEGLPSHQSDEERAAEFQKRIKLHVARVLGRLHSAESSATP